MQEAYTNMSKDEVLRHLISMEKDCEACQVAHFECRFPLPCKSCQLKFWITEFRRYLGLDKKVNF